MTAWGSGYGWLDDYVDFAILEGFDYVERLSDQFARTTWHAEKPITDVFWFYIYHQSTADAA